LSVALITGSAGLIGAEAVRHFTRRGMTVVGIDNDMRRVFFGEDGSTRWQREMLERTVPGYRHVDADIRDQAAVEREFRRYGRDIALVVHCAAQPSHDWAAQAPHVDFTVNANGTLTLLEAIVMAEEVAGRRLDWSYQETNRTGDPIWWVSDTRKLRSLYPEWRMAYGLRAILEEINRGLTQRLLA
jgi:nucleoside-diphosphate-sugar epimerase